MAFKKNETKVVSHDVVNHDVVVTRAKLFEAKDNKSEALVFDMAVNGVTIYNCRWMEGEKDGKPYKFVAFPNYKNGDKYWNYAYVALSPEDIDTIEKMLHKLIDCE